MALRNIYNNLFARFIIINTPDRGVEFEVRYWLFFETQNRVRKIDRCARSTLS